MIKIIGIRREDKNQWERRTPLVPDDVKELRRKYGIKTIVQPSKKRIFSDEEYKKAGAEINDDLRIANIVMAIKEIPEKLFEKNKTYMFFSHTIKGQSYNMNMLKQMMTMKCNLIDYERVVNERNQRLIFFGKYAGLAGMVETLHIVGQKLKLQGYDTPFEKLRQAYKYGSIDNAVEEIKKAGNEISQMGLPKKLCPLIVGFIGYGNTSKGAQEIFDILPHKEVSPNKLDQMVINFSDDVNNIYKVVFKKEHMVKSKEGDFNLKHYHSHPEEYVSKFERYIPYLSILLVCIYWSKEYPRLLTRECMIKGTSSNSNHKLKVIGDITCDIEGTVAITHKATKPDKSNFTYFPIEDRFEDGTFGSGITVMAVDNLPSIFPRESSIAFSAMVKRYINDIVSTNFEVGFETLKLQDSIKKALILQNGKLTPDYSYMMEFLK